MMPRGTQPVIDSWLKWVSRLRTYHRYEVEGLDHLDTDYSMLLVGYHGRPFAIDLVMLGATIYERFGHVPCGLMHRNTALPESIRAQLGLIPGDGPLLEAAIEEGRHLIVTPGGVREAARGFLHRYQVNWGQHYGYLRLALRYGLPIVPVGASGVDDAYWGLNDGIALAKRLGLPAGFPAWLGIGMGGLWPMAMPFPSKVRQIIGEPIWFDGLDENDLEDAHASVVDLVQSLIRRARASD
jgi:hypothetical protein